MKVRDKIVIAVGAVIAVAISVVTVRKKEK